MKADEMQRLPSLAPKATGNSVPSFASNGPGNTSLHVDESEPSIGGSVENVSVTQLNSMFLASKRSGSGKDLPSSETREQAQNEQEHTVHSIEQDAPSPGIRKLHKHRGDSPHMRHRPGTVKGHRATSARQEVFYERLPTKLALARAKDDDKEAYLVYPVDQPKAVRDQELGVQFGRPDDDKTGQRRYIDMCIQLAIRPKMQLVQQLMMSSPQRPVLTFDHYGINVKDTCALASAVSINRCAHTLSLSSNPGVGDAGVVAVCSMMRTHTRVTTLSLCKVSCTPQAAPSVAAVLSGNMNVTTVLLASNHLGDVGASIIARILTFGFARRTALTSLDLSDNRIGSEGATKLAAMLEGNDTLRRLDLSWNGISGRGAQLMMRGLADSIGLQSLRMSRNGVGEAGEHLAHSLAANRTLTELDLSHCRMGPAAAQAIAKGLKRNQALCELSLDWNPFCEGARELHATLVRRACRHDGLRWSLDNVAWDLLERSVPQPPDDQLSRSSSGRPLVHIPVEPFNLSGRHLLDLRSPHDKEVFVTITRYALEKGADAWRNETFLDKGIWKRFWFRDQDFKGETKGEVVVPRWLASTLLQVDVIANAPKESTEVLGSYHLELMLSGLERASSSMAQLAVLRDLGPDTALSSEQARELYELICARRGSILHREYARGDIDPRDVSVRKGDVFVELCARVADGRMHKVLDVAGAQDRAHLVSRVGHHRVYNPDNPSGRYTLDLGKPRDRQVLERLGRIRGTRGTEWFTRNMFVGGSKIRMKHGWHASVPGDLFHLAASWPVDTFFLLHGFNALSPEPKKNLSRRDDGSKDHVQFRSVLEVINNRDEYRTWVGEALDGEAEEAVSVSALSLVRAEIERNWAEVDDDAARELQAVVQRVIAQRFYAHATSTQQLPFDQFMELEVMDETTWTEWIPELEDSGGGPSDGETSSRSVQIGALAKARTLHDLLASSTVNNSDVDTRPPTTAQPEVSVYEAEYATPPQTAGSKGSQGVRWQLSTDSTRNRKLDALTQYKVDKKEVWGGSLIEPAHKADSRMSTPFTQNRIKGQQFERELKNELDRAKEGWWNSRDAERAEIVILDDGRELSLDHEVLEESLAALEGGEAATLEGGEGEEGVKPLEGASGVDEAGSRKESGGGGGDERPVSVKSEREETMQERLRRKFLSVQRTIRTIALMRKAMQLGQDQRLIYDREKEEIEREVREQLAELDKEQDERLALESEAAAAEAAAEAKRRLSRPGSADSTDRGSRSGASSDSGREGRREKKTTKGVDPNFHSMHKGFERTASTEQTAKPKAKEAKLEQLKSKKVPVNRQEQEAEDTELMKLLNLDAEGGGRNLNLKSVLGVVDFESSKGRRRRRKGSFSAGPSASSAQ